MAANNSSALPDNTSAAPILTTTIDTTNATLASPTLTTNATNATSTVVSSSTPVPDNATTTAVRNATVTTESPDDEGIDKVLIGGIAGGVVGFFIVGIIIICCIRKYRAKKDDDDDDDDDDDPQPLPKLDGHGRVIPNGTDSADTVNHHQPWPPEDAGTHIPIVYEDPDQPSTRAHIWDSGKHDYGNIPVKNDSSSGAYIVPLDHRPSDSLPPHFPPPPPGLGRGHQNNGFDGRRDGSQGEEPYMPMDLCNPLEPRAGGGVIGGRKTDLSRPSPCTPKKTHGYVNAPSGTPQSAHRTGFQNYQEEEEQPYYGNVDPPAHRPVLEAAASSSGFPSPSSLQGSKKGSRQKPWGVESKPSSKPVLRVSPMPSPQPSSKWEHETSFSSSPKPSPKTPHKALKPPAKPSHRVQETESPKPSPKPAPKPGKRGANPVDTDSDNENYMNLKEEPDNDYVNAPDKKSDYVNAPDKKRP